MKINMTKMQLLIQLIEVFVLFYFSSFYFSASPKHTDEMCNFYMMYYSDNSKNISSYMECIDNQVSRVSQHIPADSAKPLPPNPLLEAKASMTIHHPHTGSSNPNVKQGRLFTNCYLGYPR